MCGIFGFIGNLSKEVAMLCTNSLSHRGPDGMGLWRQNGVTLGHRRLSILDLSDNAKQPMSYANDRYWITYNGEIYNFLELRNELKNKGYMFKSNSDTEVILSGFVEWGVDCLNKFNGMWTFAIWDTHEKTLFLSRDRFGEKPLFYAFLSNGFAFASEMKALFPLVQDVRPNVRLVKDWERIFQYESTEECVIEGIKRFPAGHYAWWKDGKLNVTRWWCTLDHLPEAPTRYEEQVEQLRTLFLDACRIRMRSDVPIGTALSGGLDSSSTIAAMAYIGKNERGERISDDWQHAFVACFPNTPLDESTYAKKITDYLGIEATFINIDPLQVIDQLYDYLYLFEDIYITSPIPFMMTYGEMHSNGIKVTIDGHGADELFGGYSFDYLNALIDAGLNLKTVNIILNTFYDAYPKDFIQFRLPPKWLYWLKWRSIHAAKKILRPSSLSVKDNSHPRFKKLDELNKILYASTHENVLPTLLRNYDRYSMSNGVEIRMPFMDYRIVSFAFAIPWTSKIRKSFSKSVVRDAMSEYMPREIAYRKSKIGFNSPIVDWMKGPLKSFFLDIINSSSFKNCELIDPPAVSNKVLDVIKNTKATFSEGEQAWKLLTPYLWEQAVIKKAHK
jgi:asparagine synthase (glutamine-hydrolysing)